MAAIGFVDCIYGEHPDAIDAECVEGSGRSDHFVDWEFGRFGEIVAAETVRSSDGRQGKHCGRRSQRSWIEQRLISAVLHY